MNIIPKTLVDVMTYIAIVGGILVSFGQPFAANIVWSITNPYFVWYNYKIKQFALVKMFLIYDVISMFGIYYLWPK